MTSAAFISLFGIINLLLGWRAIKTHTPLSGVVRLLFLFFALFYGARLLDWHTSEDTLRWVALCLASGFPLLAVIFTEHVTRRHAPLPLKIFAAGAFPVLALLSILYTSHLNALIGLLGGVQILTILICLTLLYKGYKTATGSEKYNIGIILLGAIPLAPFIASDYYPPHGQAIYLSPLAASLVVWTLICAERGIPLRQRFLPLGVVTSSILLFTLTLGEGNITNGIGLLCAALTVMILTEIREAHSEKTLLSLANRQAKLAGNTPLFDDVVFPTPSVMADYDPDLPGYIKEQTMLSKDTLAGQSTLLAEQARLLLDRFECTFLLYLNTADRVALIKAPAQWTGQPNPRLVLALHQLTQDDLP